MGLTISKHYFESAFPEDMTHQRFIDIMFSDVQFQSHWPSVYQHFTDRGYDTAGDFDLYFVRRPLADNIERMISLLTSCEFGSGNILYFGLTRLTWAGVYHTLISNDTLLPNNEYRLVMTPSLEFMKNAWSGNKKCKAWLGDHLLYKEFDGVYGIHEYVQCQQFGLSCLRGCCYRGPRMEEKFNCNCVLRRPPNRVDALPLIKPGDDETTNATILRMEPLVFMRTNIVKGKLILAPHEAYHRFKPLDLEPPGGIPVGIAVMIQANPPHPLQRIDVDRSSTTCGILAVAKGTPSAVPQICPQACLAWKSCRQPIGGM
jgi:hypothetical protein